ncbi:MAG: sulfite exporter TauE/SafE family protein [Pseudomonadota bacterium]
MSTLAGLIILVAALATSFISGIFGMAGGLILMGVLVALVPVATAMVVHGAIQIVSNGWRAYLLREHVDWGVFWRYAAGSAVAVALLFAVAWRPDRTALFLMLGLIPMLVWLPKERFDLDAQRPGHAFGAGVAVQALNTVAGVAGPLLDLFFVRTDMTRRAIVATKAVTQVLAHLVKIAFWSVPIIAAAGEAAFPPIWVLIAAVPIVLTGTWLGGLVLARMTDVNFKRWMKWLVTAIGLVYLARAAGLF